LREKNLKFLPNKVFRFIQQTLFTVMKKIHPELSQLRFFYGIQSAMAIALPLLIGLLMGNLKLIILPALAAFFINLFLGSLSVSYRDKLLGMAIATLGCAGVMSLGTVSGQIPWLLVIFTFPLLPALQLYQCAGKYSYSHRTGSGSVLVYLYSPTRQSGSGHERFWLLLLAGIWGNGSTLGNMAQRSLQAS
jgi:hypothetical protein